MTNKPVILIIEDNPMTQKMFRIVLECENYKVLEARDGESALKQLNLIKPGLILQDLILPDMSHMELNQRIRTHHNGSEVPILALSGFLNKPEENEYSKAFADFLIKPIENSRLVNVVKSFLPNTSPISMTENRNARILIVDDNYAQLKILKLHLTHHGFDVDTAENGHEAIKHINQSRPDVIVSDVLMPTMDGFELCLEIRRMPFFWQTPIVLMTSQYLEESDKNLAKKAGADYYITRTPEIDKLISVLDECVKQKKPQFSSVFPEAVELFKEEHTHRLIRQLERQINANEGLAQRCALQLAHLSMLSEIAHILTDNMGIKKTLENVLSTCLDAAGISQGALYLITSDGNFKLQNMIGYNPEHKDLLEKLIMHPIILSEVLSTKNVIDLSNENPTDKFITDLLSETHMTSALLAPLISDAQCLGVLLLGSNSTRINNKDSIAFTRNLTTQIGQAIALAKAIENIYYSEQRYRILMDNASCGIFIFDTKGKLLEVNKQGEKLLNCSKSEILNQDFMNFIVDTEKTAAKFSIKKIIQEKIPIHGELRIKPLNIIERTIEYSGVEVKTQNESVIMIMTTDVSERNKLKNQALLNDKLATVGTLAAGVAHEINNPISWVMTNLIYIKNNMGAFKKLLQAMYEINQENDMNKRLKLIEEFLIPINQSQFIIEFDEMINESLQGVERVRDIVKNLKGFSRMDESDLAPVNIHDVLNVAISMASLEFKYRAKLDKNYAKNLPSILTNSGKLNQVFLNLMINSAQAIPEGNINHHVIKVTTELVGNYIRIDVSDTGQGIPPEILPHIFDPFFTTKSAGHGTGLGLPICHEIISHLNGKIEVKSILNQGSIFSVYLPILQEPLNTSCNMEDAGEAQLKKILIVDDEPYLLKSLSNTLKHQYDITTALGGHLAIETLKQHSGKFDAIICDLQMQDVNGADFYYYVSEHYPNLIQRIIFITGGLYSPMLSEFLKTVENSLIEKPFTQDELMNAIKHCILMELPKPSVLEV